MTATLDNALADLQRDNAELRRQLDECRTELVARNSEFGERIEQQSATIDVLKAMSASPGDPQPVFDLIVRRARDLCTPCPVNRSLPCQNSQTGHGGVCYDYEGVDPTERLSRAERRVCSGLRPFP
jgi:hypothetical protein